MDLTITGNGIAITFYNGFYLVLLTEQPHNFLKNPITFWEVQDTIYERAALQDAPNCMTQAIVPLGDETLVEALLVMMEKLMLHTEKF